MRRRRTARVEGKKAKEGKRTVKQSEEKGEGRGKGREIKLRKL